jgi:hypothetical protein
MQDLRKTKKCDWPRCRLRFAKQTSFSALTIPESPFVASPLAVTIDPVPTPSTMTIPLSEIEEKAKELREARILVAGVASDASLAAGANVSVDPLVPKNLEYIGLDDTAHATAVSNFMGTFKDLYVQLTIALEDYNLEDREKIEMQLNELFVQCELSIRVIKDDLDDFSVRCPRSRSGSHRLR